MRISKVLGFARALRRTRLTAGVALCGLGTLSSGAALGCTSSSESEGVRGPGDCSDIAVLACGAFEDIGLDEPIVPGFMSVNEALRVTTGSHVMRGAELTPGGSPSELVLELTPGARAQSSAADSCAPRGACGTTVEVTARVRSPDGAIDARIDSMTILSVGTTHLEGDARLEAELANPLPSPYPAPAPGSVAERLPLRLTVEFALTRTDTPRLWAELRTGDDSGLWIWTEPSP